MVARDRTRISADFVGENASSSEEDEGWGGRGAFPRAAATSPMKAKSFKERNKEHARRTRQRRKQHLEDLRQRLSELRAEALVLRAAVEEQKTALALVAMSAGNVVDDVDVVPFDSKNEMARPPPALEGILEQFEALDTSVLPSTSAAAIAAAVSTASAGAAADRHGGRTGSDGDISGKGDGADDEYEYPSSPGAAADRRNRGCTAEERQQARRERNRIHAKRTRHRKRLYVEACEVLIKQLSIDNSRRREGLRAGCGGALSCGGFGGGGDNVPAVPRELCVPVPAVEDVTVLWEFTAGVEAGSTKRRRPGNGVGPAVAAAAAVVAGGATAGAGAALSVIGSREGRPLKRRCSGSASVVGGDGSDLNVGGSSVNLGLVTDDGSLVCDGVVEGTGAPIPAVRRGSGSSAASAAMSAATEVSGAESVRNSPVFCGPDTVRGTASSRIGAAGVARGVASPVRLPPSPPLPLPAVEGAAARCVQESPVPAIAPSAAAAAAGAAAAFAADAAAADAAIYWSAPVETFSVSSSFAAEYDGVYGQPITSIGTVTNSIARYGYDGVYEHRGTVKPLPWMLAAPQRWERFFSPAPPLAAPALAPRTAAGGACAAATRDMADVVAAEEGVWRAHLHLPLPPLPTALGMPPRPSPRLHPPQPQQQRRLPEPDPEPELAPEPPMALWARNGLQMEGLGFAWEGGGDGAGVRSGMGGVGGGFGCFGGSGRNGEGYSATAGFARASSGSRISGGGSAGAGCWSDPSALLEASKQWFNPWVKTSRPST
ncbi:unnamed protein product [Phaeothamnion confervicola]